VKLFNPLPPDYASLTNEGKRLARLRVVTDHSTPEKFAVAAHFFSEWYLRPEGHPAFYKRFLSSPPFHHQMAFDMAKYRRNMLGAPRGGAKSTKAAISIPLMMLCTATGFEIALCWATDRMVEARFDRMMEQLEGNRYLIEDFGELKPNKGSGVWNRHYLRLRNGARAEGFSVDGRKRGARPDLFILDDPEYDPDTEAMSVKLREQLERLMFRIVLPMLDEGTAIFWVGTIIDRRSFLYYALEGQDKRFERWNRRILAAGEPTCDLMEIFEESNENDGKAFRRLIWPAKWSSQALCAKVRELGPSAFSAEYLNKPVSEQARLLYVEPRRNRYHVRGQVPGRPLDACEAEIQYWMKDTETNEYEKRYRAWGDWIMSLYRVLFIDYCYEPGPHSDYSFVAVAGFDEQDVAWGLDCWGGKLTGNALNNEIIRLWSKWQAHIVCPEAVSLQKLLVEQTTQQVHEKGERVGWKPKDGVHPPEYPRNTPKGNRIADALEWRLLRGRMKFPADVTGQACWGTDSQYAFHMTEQQLSDFTIRLDLLPVDDAVDTWAMMGYVPHLRGVAKKAEPRADSTVGWMQEGRIVHPDTGMPLISGMNASEIPQDVLDRWSGFQYNGIRLNRRVRSKMETRFDERRPTRRLRL